MLTDVVKRCIVRDLGGFTTQLEAYPDEASIWTTPAGIPNSAGNLTLHACGNLRHFIGHLLGGTDYVRDRDYEFAARDVPRGELDMLITAAREEVSRALEHLNPDLLARDFPVQIAGATLSTGQFIVHLAVHLTYHLGQVDIHRRIVSGNSAGLGMVVPKALVS